MKLLEPAEYQVAAENVFLQVRDEILHVLPEARVEHIGASSIQGSVSKGDVDICVIVDSLAHELAVSALQRLGYSVKADTLRTAELCMLESERQDVDLALQVVAGGSRFEFFMTFRDALRSDPSLAAAYNEVKLKHQDMSAADYRAAKTRFIEAVLRNA
ncbi:MAG: GrpB family protein [Comamonadaceae bacterium]|nr:MAG: GrpB family protein [Comamonadaceae bacterium]